MKIRSIFTAPAESVHPIRQYGMLVIFLVLLASQICWYLGLSASYEGDPYVTTIVILMLLFHHLAYEFRWPLIVTVALRILAMVWAIFGLCYVICSSWK